MNLLIKNTILVITLASTSASATGWDVGLDKKNFPNTLAMIIMYAGSARACDETMIEGNLTRLYEKLQSYGKQRGYSNAMTNSLRSTSTEVLIQAGAKAQKVQGKISCSEVAFYGAQLYKNLNPTVLGK
jgi:hypothetical protein